MPDGAPSTESRARELNKAIAMNEKRPGDLSALEARVAELEARTRLEKQ